MHVICTESGFFEIFHNMNRLINYVGEAKLRLYKTYFVEKLIISWIQLDSQLSNWILSNIIIMFLLKAVEFLGFLIMPQSLSPNLRTRYLKKLNK